MSLYYFDYLYKYENLMDLINYLEKEYKITYKEVIEIPSIFSINIFGLSIGFNRKIVVFRTKRNMNKVHRCENCNFPIEYKDLKSFKGKEDEFVCMNCNIAPK